MDVVFDEIDADGSGDLTMNELLPFLVDKQGLTKKAAIRTIRKVDVDGNGVVDRHEFQALLVRGLVQFYRPLPQEQECSQISTLCMSMYAHALLCR